MTRNAPLLPMLRRIAAICLDVVFVLAWAVILYFHLVNDASVSIGSKVYSFSDYGDMLLLAMLAPVLRIILPPQVPGLFGRKGWSAEWTEKYAIVPLLLIIGIGALLFIPYFDFFPAFMDWFCFRWEYEALLDGNMVIKDDIYAPHGEPTFYYLFRQHGFVSAPQLGGTVCKYSIGWPLHKAVGGVLLGREFGGFIAQAFFSLLMLPVLFLVGRELFGAREGLLAAWMLALSSIWQYEAASTMSDNVTGLWSMLAFLFALRTAEHWRWGLACGAGLGILVVVRPNLGFLIPLYLLWLVLHKRWKSSLALCVGGVPFAVFYAVWQSTFYGSATGSGYGSLSHLFSYVGFWERFGFHATETLWRNGNIWVVFAAIGLLTGRKVVSARVLLFSIIAVVFVFYGFHRYGIKWNGHRYLMPALWGLYVITGRGVVLVAESFRGRTGVLLARMAPAIFLASVTGGYRQDISAHNWHQTFFHNARRYQDMQEIRLRTEENAIIFCHLHTASLRFYGQRRTLSDEAAPTAMLLRHVRFLLGNGEPVYVLDFPQAPSRLLAAHPQAFEFYVRLQCGSRLYRPKAGEFLTMDEQDKIARGWCMEFEKPHLLRLVRER